MKDEADIYQLHLFFFKLYKNKVCDYIALFFIDFLIACYAQ